MKYNDELGTRMKEFYENIPKTKLTRRTPVIIRIDGKAFHTFTRGFQKPFDELMVKTMQDTTKYLCENIQGCVLGYTQSDEISLVLVDYKKLTSSAWFDYEVQKMCSVAASMATMAFNKYFSENHDDWGIKNFGVSWFDGGTSEPVSEEILGLSWKYGMAIEKGAMFDARVFSIPKEEVTNCIYWRQLDATRNSIQAVGQAYFSHKELDKKTCNDIQDMLMTQKNINWNDFPTHLKRGTCVIKRAADAEHERSEWIIDTEIPIFKSEGREYIDSLITFEEE